jgi:small nuclear ribonucleoprotein (snRNP)-like protein
MIRKSLVTGILLMSFNLLWADQVILNNGDRLTGTIVKSDEKDLVFKTDYAGELTIHWDAVLGISSSESLYVGLKGGRTAVGRVSSTDGTVQVATASSGTVQASKADVLTLRNDAEQNAWEKSQYPGLLEVGRAVRTLASR